MAKSTVIFTTSWNVNKHGVYPSNVIDIVPSDLWEKNVRNQYSDWTARYANLLDPMANNLRYYIEYMDNDQFKLYHTNTGHRKYKRQKVNP